jgi:membrane protein
VPPEQKIAWRDVVVLLWVYYSSQIFLLGAEFTHQYALARGRDPGEGLGPHAAPPTL